MRWLAGAVLMVAGLAGCLAADDEPTAVPDDVQLTSNLTNRGDLPVWYVVRVREFEEDERLEDQDGPIESSQSGSLQPDQMVTVPDRLAGARQHWVEIRFATSPTELARAQYGVSFHVDPAVCSALVADAYAESGLTGSGAGSTVRGCSQTFLSA